MESPAAWSERLLGFANGDGNGVDRVDLVAPDVLGGQHGWSVVTRRVSRWAGLRAADRAPMASRCSHHNDPNQEENNECPLGV